MSIGLAGQLVGLAALDSLNPAVLIVAGSLATSERRRPSVVFAGVLAALDVVVGLAVVRGARSLGADLQSSRVLAAALLAVSLVLLVIGLNGLRRRGAVVRPPKLLPQATGAVTLVAASYFAATLPAAGQFFVGMEKIADREGSALGDLAFVALYTAVFTLPLWALVAWRSVRRSDGLSEAGLRRLARLGDVLLVLSGLLLGEIALGRLA